MTRVPARESDRPRSLRTLDLFAGAGGLTEGLRRAGGFTSVQAVELDLAAAASYAANHRGSNVYVGTVERWLEEGDVPEVDVIVGGPPCQGFSTLGKQDGEDARNNLWKHYAATVLRVQPTYFVVENVGAFRNSAQFEQFRIATHSRGMLADYSFEAQVLNAADYGAPQARKRTVLIGHHRDVAFPGWPTKTHEGRHVSVRAALRGAPETVTSAELPPGKVFVDEWRRFAVSSAVSMPPSGLPGRFSTRQLHVGRRYSQVSLNRFREIPEGGNRFDLPDHLKAPCWIGHTTGSADVMGRLHWDRPSVTIRTEFFKPEKGRYLHPCEQRAITHYEAALLQGFPLNYQWVGSKTAIACQIGNAVPIALGTAIGRALSAQNQH